MSISDVQVRRTLAEGLENAASRIRDTTNPIPFEHGYDMPSFICEMTCTEQDTGQTFKVVAFAAMSESEPRMKEIAALLRELGGMNP